MTVSEVNYDLFDKALTAIEQHPDQWDQAAWTSNEAIREGDSTDPMCGTSFCLAGWALVESGQYEVYVKNLNDPDSYEKYPWFRHKVTGDDVSSAGQTASELLGIQYRSLGYTLFESGESMEAGQKMTPVEFRVWVKEKVAEYEARNVVESL